MNQPNPSHPRGGFGFLVVLAAFLTLFATSVVSASRTPAAPGGAIPASQWAGSFPLHRTMPTLAARSNGPGAFSNLQASSALSDLQVATTEDPINGTWSLLAGSGGPALGPRRVTHSAIFDPVRNRTVVFGGGGSTYANDTWVLASNGTQWNPLTTQGTPPSPRRLHTAVYDPVNDRMLVYGGFDGGFLGDVWQLDFQSSPAAWSQLTPGGTAPAGRAGHAAIYDPQDRRMIVFAGYDGSSAPSLRRKDVWALSLQGSLDWAEITPAVDGPSARSSLEAVYDSPRHRMVVFGGTDPAFTNDAWALALDGSPVWSAIAPAGSLPAAREEHSAIYDPNGDRLVMFGGYDQDYYFGDVWALGFSGTPQWTQLDPTGLGPGPRWGHTAVHDFAAGSMVVVSGFTPGGVSNDTYVLGLSGAPAWTNPIVGPGPGPMRHTFAAAYDSERHRFLLFGGSDVSSYLNDTRAITLGENPQWSVITTQGIPPSPRRLAEAIYDPKDDRLIVFGGFNGTILGDLWQLSFATNPPTWSPLVAAGPAPAARAGHGVIYDSRGKRMIMFGGYDGVSVNNRRNDLWALDLGNNPEWHLLTPLGTPPSPRSSFSAVYDEVGDRMIVFGGTTPTFLNDTWELSLQGMPTPTWSQLSPTGVHPTPREEQSAMYDPVRERMIIFGGYENSLFYGTRDTWSLSLGASPGWTMLTATPQPTFRWGHAAVYDPVYDRMVMHGGLGPGLDQTWALTWGQPAMKSPILLESVAESDQVRLTWGVSSGAMTAAVYRAQEGGSWVKAADAPVGPEGEVLYEDNSVTPGVRYGYRAGVMAGGTELVSTDAWLDVPGLVDVGGDVPRLAITGARRQGVDLSVRISLASSAPARLLLLDVGGRMLAQRELGSRGPGSQEVALGVGSRIPSGVYWLRLTQVGHGTMSKTIALP